MSFLSSSASRRASVGLLAGHGKFQSNVAHLGRIAGRAMELGRECLQLWGYKRVDELIWVKTNQLQRLIRTGRTGHWLNHSKEHCLVGVKGSPQINRNLDCDVLVAEVWHCPLSAHGSHSVCVMHRIHCLFTWYGQDSNTDTRQLWVMLCCTMMCLA